MDSLGSTSRSARVSGRAATAFAALLVVAVLLSVFAFTAEVLYDTDSYYHLAVARVYSEIGIVDELGWARFSVMRDGFGDKDFLFHLLLLPFVVLLEPAQGGRLALALLNGAVAATLVFVAFRAVGRWAALVPALFFLGSQDVADRMIRLRPELLALILFVLAADCAGRGRLRTLGVVVLVFTLSYTAFHALLLLCGLWFVVRWLARGEFAPGLLLYPLVGAGLGLIAHPHFPHNLVVWKVQTFDFFRYKSVLDVGTEIQPATTSTLALNNWGWIAAVLILFASLHKPAGRAEETETAPLDRSAEAFGVAAALFCGLVLMMHRFTIYAVPFCLLACAFEAKRRGLQIGWRTRPIGRFANGLLMAPLLVVALALPAGRVVHQLWGMATASGGALSREEDWTALGRTLPAGAKVAAEWGRAQPLTLFAPHALYLNVLDPVFMAVPYPEAYAAVRGIFEGAEPDLVTALLRTLDSEVLVISRFHRPQEVVSALYAHPQLAPIYEGYTLAFRVLPPSPGAALPWALAPADAQRPISEVPAAWASLGTNRISSFVSLDSATTECALVAVRGETPSGRHEIAAWGPTEVWQGPKRILTAPTSLRQMAGSGLDIELLGDGPLTVLSCRDPKTGRRGFSLRPLPQRSQAQP